MSGTLVGRRSLLSPLQVALSKAALQMEKKSGGTWFPYGFLGHWGSDPFGWRHPM